MNMSDFLTWFLGRKADRERLKYPTEGGLSGFFNLNCNDSMSVHFFYFKTVSFTFDRRSGLALNILRQHPAADCINLLI